MHAYVLKALLDMRRTVSDYELMVAKVAGSRTASKSKALTVMRPSLPRES